MIKKFSGLFALIVALGVALTSQAHAALDLTGVTFPMTDIEAVAALILAAAAGIWIIYKVLTLIRKG